MQTVAAFLNGKGGIVLCGIRPDGRIEGHQVSDQTLRDFAEAFELESEAESSLDLPSRVLVVLAHGLLFQGPDCSDNRKASSRRPAEQCDEEHGGFWAHGVVDPPQGVQPTAGVAADADGEAGESRACEEARAEQKHAPGGSGHDPSSRTSPRPRTSRRAGGYMREPLTTVRMHG
jgi:hypothetical protein